MEKLSFEQKLNQVKEITDGIESSQMPLEEAVKQFEAGMKTLRELEKELGEMKRRITVLQEKPDGSMEEAPMEKASQEDAP